MLHDCHIGPKEDRIPCAHKVTEFNYVPTRSGAPRDVETTFNVAEAYQGLHPASGKEEDVIKLKAAPHGPSHSQLLEAVRAHWEKHHPARLRVCVEVLVEKLGARGSRVIWLPPYSPELQVLARHVVLLLCGPSSLALGYLRYSVCCPRLLNP